MKYRSFNISNKPTARLIVVFAIVLGLFSSGCKRISPKLQDEYIRPGLSQGMHGVFDRYRQGRIKGVRYNYPLRGQASRRGELKVSGTIIAGLSGVRRLSVKRVAGVAAALKKVPNTFNSPQDCRGEPPQCHSDGESARNLCCHG